MFQRLSVSAETLKYKMLKKCYYAGGFLLPGLSEGENMTNVRNDTAKR